MKFSKSEKLGYCMAYIVDNMLVFNDGFAICDDETLIPSYKFNPTDPHIEAGDRFYAGDVLTITF